MAGKSKLDKLFEKAEREVEKSTGVGFLDMKEFERQFGVPGYISTGLWDLDYQLMHDENRAHYGVPRSRMTEIHGQSSSFKTTLCHRLCADTIAQGGRVYWLSTELDFDREYALRHIREYGVDEETADKNFKSRPVRTIIDMHNTLNNLITPLEEAAEEMVKKGKTPHKEFGPVLFVVDSIASFLSGGDYDKLDKDADEGQRVGGRAAELHRFFQFFLYSIARIGAALVITNHYRSNIGARYGGYVPASDSPIKYYASLRLSCWSSDYTPNSKDHPKRNGQEYTFGRSVNVRVHKIRGDWTVDGQTNLIYQYAHGFDYYWSALLTLVKSGVAEMSSSEYIIDEPEDSPLAVLNGHHDQKELKAKLAEHVEQLPSLMYEAMKRKPVSLEDLREGPVREKNV